MKKKICFLNYVILILFISSGIIQSQEKSLAELYKSGQIRLEQTLLITDENMPEDTYFQNPMGVTSTPDGRLFVSDYNANHIKIFDSSGKFLDIIGREGQGPGEFNGPYRICYFGDELLVYELRARRFSIFKPDGTYLRNSQVDMLDGSPRKIQALPDGRIVMEKEKTYLWRETRPQECRLKLLSSELKTIKVLFEYDIWRNRYITKPQRTNIPQPFYMDMVWEVMPDGRILVGLSENYEIFFFSPDKGRLSGFKHEYKPVEVTKKERDEWFGKMTYNFGNEIKQGAQPFVVKNTKFPKNKPAFHDIKVDAEGNILVFTHTDGINYDYTFFDAFDPQGRFINRVEVKGDFHFQGNTIRLGEFFASIQNGFDDQFQIQLYKIVSGDK
ncbi:6-bladed beta-propeller [Acidobacteriota bacterium]